LDGFLPGQFSNRPPATSFFPAIVMRAERLTLVSRIKETLINRPDLG
jgi:hypothetical protein